MDYKDYLAEKPFMIDFPRHIVEIHHSDGRQKTFFVNNQLINAHKIDSKEGLLHKALDDFFESNDEAIEAKIYRLHNPKNKELLDSISR